MSVSETMSDNGRCRLCVREKPNQISVFRRNLSMRIMKLADVVIREDDWLPKTICLDCEIDIEKCFEFIARIQWADKKFRDEANQIEVEESIFIKQEHCQFENFMEEDCDDVQDHCDSKIQDESDKLPAETKDEIGQSAEPFNLVEIIKDEERLDLMEENEERSNNAEAAKDPLSQGEPFLEVQGRDEYAPAIDPLICLKEEAEAVDLAPSTSTKSSSVRPTTLVPSIPMGVRLLLLHVPVHSGSGRNKPNQEINNFSGTSPMPNDFGSISSSQNEEVNTAIIKSEPLDSLPMELVEPHCSICNMDFSNWDELNEHKESTEFLCRVCTTSFQSHVKLESHFVTHQSKCKKCSKIFYSRKDSMNHRKFSNSCSEWLECDYCKKKFLNKKGLNLHKRKFHLPHNFNGVNKCVVCLLTFSLPSMLKDHLRSVHTAYELLKCDFCHRLYLGPEKLRDHIKAAHVSRLIEEICACSICNKTFQTKDRLSAHFESHDKTPQLCDLCGKSLNGKNAMKSHMRIEHKNMGSFTCECCNKHFNTKTKFMRHINVKARSNASREVYCEICGKKFKSSTILKNHQLIHSGKRQFKCDICSATFVQSVALKTHSRIHSNVNPYLCKLCGKSFRWKQTFDKHVKKCDGAEIEDEVSDSSSSNETSNVG